MKLTTKAFTLVELLAVLVILSILLIISVPKFKNILLKSKLDVFIVDTKSMVKTIETSSAVHTAFSKPNAETQYRFIDGVRIKNFGDVELNYKGKDPENGIIYISDDNKVSLALYRDGICLTKTRESKEIIASNKSKEECEVTTYIYSSKSFDDIASLFGINKHLISGWNQGISSEATLYDRIININIPIIESSSIVAKVTDSNPGIMSGTGVIANPFLIESIEDLVALSINTKNGNNYSGKYIHLVTNLDFNDKNSYVDQNTKEFGDINEDGIIEGLKKELTTGKGFLPIGSSAKQFNGRLFGNFNTIYNLYINRPLENSVAFIGYTRGVITTLNLTDVNVTGNNYTAGLCGYNWGSISDVLVTGDVTGNTKVGLVMGHIDHQNTAIGIMANGNVKGNSQVGGLIGYTYTGARVRGILLGGSVTGNSSVNRIVGATRTQENMLSLSVPSVTVNGVLKNSDNSRSLNGADIESLEAVNTIELAENVFDTYIGGDNTGNGYYYDYDSNNKLVRKSTSEYPLTFNLKGSGTAASPYLISNKEDLKQASLKPASTYSLVADIDMHKEPFYPLGSYLQSFGGTFRGNANTISNIKINAPLGSQIGFFGNNIGTITGLKLENINVTGKNGVGAIAGYNRGTINNVIVTGSATGNDQVSLVVGYGDQRVVTSVVVQGDVSGVSYVGGITGYVYGNGLVRGVNRGGSITASGTNFGRVIGGKYGNLYPINDIKTGSNKEILINNSAVSSTIINSKQGIDMTKQELEEETLYKNMLFNFTEETTYVWYFENGLINFRKGIDQ